MVEKIQEKKWQTTVGGETKDDILVRGYKLTDLIEKATFTQTIFLVLKGVMPTKKEERIFNAMLVAAVEHGLGTPSTTVARTVQSCGNQLNASVAAGIITQGDYHGGAIDKCMETLSNALKTNISAKDLVKHALENKNVLHGFGHKVYKQGDPRTLAIINILQQENSLGKYVKLVLEMEKEIEKQKGTKIVLNIDGIIAGVALDLGFPCELGKGFFMISGLVAHCTEELQQHQRFRRISEDDYEYVGEKGKKL